MRRIICINYELNICCYLNNYHLLFVFYCLLYLSHRKHNAHKRAKDSLWYCCYELIIVKRDFRSRNYDYISLLFNRNVWIVHSLIYDHVVQCSILVYLYVIVPRFVHMHIQYSTFDVEIIVPIHPFIQL